LIGEFDASSEEGMNVGEVQESRNWDESEGSQGLRRSSYDGKRE